MGEVKVGTEVRAAGGSLRETLDSFVRRSVRVDLGGNIHREELLLMAAKFTQAAGFPVIVYEYPRWARSLVVADPAHLTDEQKSQLKELGLLPLTGVPMA